MIDPDVFERCQWTALRSYFQTHGHDHHQIRGWEHFLKTILQQIIQEQGFLILDTQKNGTKEHHEVSIGHVTVWPPTVKESNGEERRITPNEARIRGLSLTNAVTCEVTHTIRNVDAPNDPPRVRRYNDLLLVNIPAMVGIEYHDMEQDFNGVHASKEALFHEGGYFIVSGNERVLTPQLKLRVNRLFLFPGKHQGKHSYVAEIRSLHTTKFRSTSTMRVCVDHNGNNITVILPFLKRGGSGSSPFELGLRSIFVLHGIVSEDDAFACICPSGWPTECQELVRQALKNDPLQHLTRDQIITYMGKNGTDLNSREKRLRYITHILQSETLPHLGMDLDTETQSRKAFFIAKMCRDVVAVHFGHKAPSNRDDNSNRKLDGPGPLMSVLFRQIFRLFLKTLRSSLIRAFESQKTDVMISDYVNANKMSGSLRYHFATGNWSLTKGLNMYVQNLNRTSIAATLSQLGRVNTPINKDGAKNTAARELHTSDYGLYCAAETPEGAGVGVTKNLALLAHVCNTTLDEELFEMSVAEWLACTPLQWGHFHPAHVVYVNGNPIGEVEDVHEARRTLVAMRRCQDGVPFDACLCILDDDLWVYTSVGRVTRPVFVLEHLPKVASVVDGCADERDVWQALLLEGVIEYLDSLEEHTHARVAECPDTVEDGHTHVEIHGLAMYSFTTALQVFSNHNQAPRVTFQSAQIKQALNPPLIEFGSNQRMDLHGFGQETCQRPLVTTRMETLRHQSTLPAGMSVILAVLCSNGWNQEDAFVINKSFTERGGGVSVFTHTFTSECKSSSQRFERPSADIANRRGRANYATVDEDGLPRVGERLTENDVVIGKTDTSIFLTADGKQSETKRCKSVVIGPGQSGIVDTVCITTTKEGFPLARVKVRQRRTMTTGNKICSRHGQKGTIGRVVEAQDMPFNGDGVTPDVIMNPLALPSRMTIGELIEGVLGKSAALLGKRGDGTAFRGTSAEDIAETLHSLGFHRGGKEQLYDGVTGKPFEALVYMCPVYHEILKHFVEDKQYTRTTGKVTVKNRQPPEGRRRDGGLRFGEMERDVSEAQGGSAVVRDRLFEQSDPFQVPVCTHCGYIGIQQSSKAYGKSMKPSRCRLCGEDTDVQTTNVPYATKQWVQMLEACNIGVQMLGRPGSLAPDH